MVETTATDSWKATYPGAIIGMLEVSGIDNTVVTPKLDTIKREVEARVRTRYAGFSRADFYGTPVLQEYEQYYKSFEKSYHVQLQLESIVLKNKSLPNVSPLVDSNFVAEIETLVLTAGHDVEKLRGPLVIDISRADDVITQMNGSTKPMRSNDMVMRDSGGVCCSIIYGQDNRSPISRETTHALYVCYAPPGVTTASVEAQIDGILENIRTFAPDVVVVSRTLIRGS